MGDSPAAAPARASGMARDPSSASPASPPPSSPPASPPNPAGRPVAASPIPKQRKKATYTFGLYKKAKIALGLKKPARPDPGALGAAPALGNHDRTGTPRTSVDAPSLVGRVFGSPTRPRAPAFEPPIPETDGPWYIIEDAVPWHGPAVPSRGPDEHEEPFMVTSPKTLLGPHHLLPWEGVEWVGPQVLKIIETGLKEYAVNPAAGRPDTRNASPAVQMYHMRRAVADVLPTPLFSFLLRVFEGPDTDPAVACDQFLERLLKGCGHAVYSTITDPTPKAFEKVSDSKQTGAAMFFRVFLVRFAKRFPQQHGFVHPKVDDLAERERLIETVEEGFQCWEFMRATESHPAAIVVRMTNKGVKALVKAPQPASWVALNHMYEFCITEPSRERSGHPSIFIIDLGKIGISICTRSNVTAIAGQLQAAMFHPEPFSAFVVAHAPSVIQFIWGVAKYFLTESARDKFVILNGSASSHFQKKLGLSLDGIPTAVGGKCDAERLLSVADLLRLRTQTRARDAYVEEHGGEDIASHRARTLRRAGSSTISELFALSKEGTPGTPGTPRDGAGTGMGTGTGTGTGTRSGTAKRRESAKDLRRRIVKLEGKLERAGADAGAAAARAAEKLKEMKRTYRALMWVKVFIALLLVLLLVAAWVLWGGSARVT